MQGLLTHIQRESWSLFFTGTYRTVAGKTERVRRAMQFQFLRRLSEFTGTKVGPQAGPASWERLTWVLREEYGEATDRVHWHALIGGLRLGVTTPKTCMFMMGFWEGIGGGMARCRVYDAGQGAAEYIAKGLEGETGGANRYEVGKFGDETLMLIPSDSLLAKWKRNAAKNGGRHSAHVG